MRVRPTILNKRGNIPDEPVETSQPKVLKRPFDQSLNCPLCHSPSSLFVGLDSHLKHIHGKVSCKGCGTLIGLNKVGFHKCHEQENPKNPNATNERNGQGENSANDSIQSFKFDEVKQKPMGINNLIDQNGREVKAMNPDPNKVIMKKLFYQQRQACAKCEYYCGKICDCDKMVVKNPKIQFFELNGHEVKQLDPNHAKGTMMKKPHYKIRLDKSVSNSFKCSKCGKVFNHDSLDHKDCIYQSGDKNPPKVLKVKTEINEAQAKANEEFWNDVQYKPLEYSAIAKENEIYCDVNVKQEVIDPFDEQFSLK